MRIAVVGDVHGHLGLLYAILGRWQQESGNPIHLVLQVGDLGAFGPGSSLDRATARHARSDPEELGFAEFGGPNPPATLLDPRPPLVFIPGNHEDFGLLDRKEASVSPDQPVYPVSEDGRILALKSGRVWRFERDGVTLAVGGVSGVAGRSRRKHHPRAHLAEEDALGLAERGPGTIDVLISHERPAQVSGRFVHDLGGSDALALLVEAVQPRISCYGHYDQAGEWQIGRTRVFGLCGCGYALRGAGPVKPRAILMVDWKGSDLEVHWLEPAWLAGVRLGEWRRWR